MSLKIRGQNHSNCDKSLYIPVYSEQNCMTIVKKQTSSDISTVVSGKSVATIHGRCNVNLAGI